MERSENWRKNSEKRSWWPLRKRKLAVGVPKIDFLTRWLWYRRLTLSCFLIEVEGLTSPTPTNSQNRPKSKKSQCHECWWTAKASLSLLEVRKMGRLMMEMRVNRGVCRDTRLYTLEHSRVWKTHIFWKLIMNWVRFKIGLVRVTPNPETALKGFLTETVHYKGRSMKTTFQSWIRYLRLYLLKSEEVPRFQDVSSKIRPSILTLWMTQSVWLYRPLASPSQLRHPSILTSWSRCHLCRRSHRILVTMWYSNRKS